jgi:hypothetical protein
MNCPKCHYPESLEVLIDAYVVRSFVGFHPTGEPMEGGVELRTDTFDDVKVMCAQCGEEVVQSDFNSPAIEQSKGNCYECGELALFCAPERYWNRTEKPGGLDIPGDLTNNNLLCGVHAANAVAFDGERIVPLYFDDTDYGDGDPPAEWVAIGNHYPIKEGDT